MSSSSSARPPSAAAPPLIGRPAEGIQLHVEKAEAQDQGREDDQESFHVVGDAALLMADAGQREGRVGAAVAGGAARRLLVVAPLLDRLHRVGGVAGAT